MILSSIQILVVKDIFRLNCDLQKLGLITITGESAAQTTFRQFPGESDVEAGHRSETAIGVKVELELASRNVSIIDIK